MVNNFTLKGIAETFHDIESTNDEMGETNLNVKEYGNLPWCMLFGKK